MANRAPMEFSPFLGPDSLRQFLYLSKKLFENHTPRTYGFEDTKGSYYEGTVENWGSEELMESRKLLLNKPSLKNILIENTFDYYFDVQYSGFVNTYDQQSLLCALLRKDVLLSNHTYKLQFTNAYEFSVPRAASSSDPLVRKDRFVMSLTPPTLIIDGSTSVTLKLTDVTGATTAYYFHMGVETEDIIDTFEDNTLITKELDDSMNGYPMIWMCVDVLKTLPDIRFEGNEYGEDEKPLLTIGTDGHDISLVYPFLSLTDEEINLDHVLIKILPSDMGSFTVDPEQYMSNFEVDVVEIHFCIYNDGNIDVHERPDRELVVLYDNENSRLTLHHERMLYWSFREPVQGDYDYDGATYRNRIYAYIYASSFSNNLYYDNDIVPRPCLELHMAEEYAYPTEYLSLNTYSGVHVDVTSDHSDNDVNKKNGVIHDLGDYDGLPRYFTYDEKLIGDGKMMNKKIHRAHVEMYSLRDKYNDPYQKSTDKPTAAVIVDSGVPQVEYDEMTDGLPLTIVFDRDNPDDRHFYWDPDNPPISGVNVLSEINYVDMYHLGNARIVSQASKPKLIYHGNRHFSLYKVGFDPELEFGRVYLITNDKADYENNDTSEHPKAPSTFARICDIPTKYDQITGIENKSPTFVLDTNYVRTESNYSHEDIDRLMNERGMEHLLHNGNRYVFDYYTSTNFITLATSEYPAWTELVSVIDLNDITTVSFSFDAGGINYAEGDLFDFYIGGVCIRGKIEEMDNGSITKVSYMNQIHGGYNDDRPIFAGDYGRINRCMFNAYQTAYETNTKTGSGSGLRIIVTIDETYFNTLHRTNDGIIDGVYYFFKDSYDNIFVYEYDKTDNDFTVAGQVTGLIEYKNKYDTARSRKYTLLDTFLYSKMNNKATVLTTPTVDPWDFYSRNIYSDAAHAPAGAPYLDPSGMTDMSVYLNDDIIDLQDTFYLLKPSYGQVSDYHAMITRFSNNAFTDDSRYTNIDYPDFGDLNLPTYYMKSNVLKYTFNEDGCTISIYDPNKSTKKTTTKISNDTLVVTDEKAITLKDVLINSRFTPQDIFDSQGRLGYNIYSYNEFDTSYRDKLRHDLSEKEREKLIEIITGMNENAYPLQFEDTGFAFTKEMLVEYIIDNDLYQGPDSVYYTDGPESIYRRQGVKIFAYKGSTGETPTGGFVEVIEEIYPKRKINNTDYEINPEYIFRLDDVDPMTLGGFKMYDGDIDITSMTMLIINSERYVARIISGGVSWVKIQRRND